MMGTVRWNVAVSKEVDESLRIFLANSKGNLSLFIEEAVRSHILELTAEQAKSAHADVDEEELASMIDESLEWARQKE